MSRFKWLGDLTERVVHKVTPEFLRRMKTRRVQEEADYYALYLRMQRRINPTFGNKPSDVEEASKLSPRDLAETVLVTLDQDIRGMLTALYNSDNQVKDDLAAEEAQQRLGSSQGTPGSDTASEVRPEHHHVMAATLAQVEEDVRADLERKHRSISKKEARMIPLLREELGFTLEVIPSSVEGGGLGVRVNGRAPIGTLVALYCGTVYTAQYHSSMPGYPNIIQDNDYLIARYDDAIIDGLDHSLKNVSQATIDLRLRDPPEQLTMSREQLYYEAEGDATTTATTTMSPFQEQEEARGPARNLYAVGHYVNHPPRGVLPNVLGFGLNFRPDIPSQLHYYIPNRYFKPPGMLEEARDTLVKGYGLVTLRDVQDEELFLNYRFNPRAKYPAWYYPVDEEENYRRWGVQPGDIPGLQAQRRQEAEEYGKDWPARPEQA